MKEYHGTSLVAQWLALPQSRGPRFDPCRGTRPHVPQLRVHTLHGATEPHVPPLRAGAAK